MTDDLFPGIAIHTDLVDEFDARSAAMAERRMEAAERETYANGVRRLIHGDPDGKEIGLGGAPVAD